MNNITASIERLENQTPPFSPEAASDIRTLIAAVKDYSANLGDIVTYGTTADVLDYQLGLSVAALKEARMTTIELNEKLAALTKANEILIEALESLARMTDAMEFDDMTKPANRAIKAAKGTHDNS